MPLSALWAQCKGKTTNDSFLLRDPETSQCSWNTARPGFVELVCDNLIFSLYCVLVMHIVLP